MIVVVVVDMQVVTVVVVEGIVEVKMRVRVDSSSVTVVVGIVVVKSPSPLPRFGDGRRDCDRTSIRHECGRECFVVSASPLIPTGSLTDQQEAKQGSKQRRT